MKQSKIFRENAENCAHLADATTAEPLFNRYKRMEAAWRALADGYSPTTTPPAQLEIISVR
jgi:hypothetical protein